MMIPSLRGILDRDLQTLGRELDAYPDDAALWQELPGIPNPGGTLALHLCGNLRHYIGAVLGRSGYVRDREAEFADRGVPRTELGALIEETRTEVRAALDGLSPERLTEDFPVPMGGVTAPVGEVLMHLSGHLAYHLGQLDYHRRAVTGDSRTVGAIALKELPSARPAG